MMAYTDCTGYKRLAFLATWIPSWALTLNKHERTERIYLLGVRSPWRHRVSGLKSISEGDFIEPKKLQLAPTTYSLSLSLPLHLISLQVRGVWQRIQMTAFVYPLITCLNNMHIQPQGIQNLTQPFEQPQNE